MYADFVRKYSEETQGQLRTSPSALRVVAEVKPREDKGGPNTLSTFELQAEFDEAEWKYLAELYRCVQIEGGSYKN